MSILYYLLYIILHCITAHYIVLHICLRILFYVMCNFFLCLSCIPVLFYVMYDLCMFQYDTIVEQSHTVIMTCFIS